MWRAFGFDIDVQTVLIFRITLYRYTKRTFGFDIHVHGLHIWGHSVPIYKERLESILMYKMSLYLWSLPIYGDRLDSMLMYKRSLYLGSPCTDTWGTFGIGIDLQASLYMVLRITLYRYMRNVWIRYWHASILVLRITPYRYTRNVWIRYWCTNGPYIWDHSVPIYKERSRIDIDVQKVFMFGITLYRCTRNVWIFSSSVIVSIIITVLLCLPYDNVQHSFNVDH